MVKEFLAALVIVSTTATVAFADPPAVKVMAEPQVGDHWTYTQRDEITGQVKGTFTQTVTEVRDEDVGLRVSWPGKSTWLLIYDRNWNIKDSLSWRFLPSDGWGFQPPLALGATWNFDVEQKSRRGITLKGSRKGRVVGQSQLTTRIGRFDAFEVEVNFTNERGDSSEEEGAVRSWYAPAINHWVKRVIEKRRNGRLMSKETEELTDYGRREGN